MVPTTGGSKVSRIERAAGLLKTHPVASVLAIALMTRVGVAVGLFLSEGGVLFSDDALYVQLARDTARGDTELWDAFVHGLYDKTAAFMIPLTAMMRVFDGSVLAGQLLVAAAGTLTAMVTTLIARHVVGASWAVMSGVVVAVLPSQVLWSSLVLKDAFVWLAAAVAGLAVLEIGRRIPHGAVALGVALASLGWLRTHTLVLVALACVVAAVLRLRELRSSAAIVLVLAALVPAAHGLGPFGMSFVLDQDSFAEVRNGNAVGADTALVTTTTAPPVQGGGTADDRPCGERSEPCEPPASANGSSSTNEDARPVGTNEDARPDDRAGDLAHLREGLPAVLLRPFPWELGGPLGSRLAALEAIAWWPLLGLAAFGMVAAALRRDESSLRLAFPVALGLGTWLVLALTEGNLGTAYRHRAEIVWVIAVVAASGAKEVAARLDRRRS